mgnify:CR=1 FL=1
MPDQGTSQERRIFRGAYNSFAAQGDAPANQDEGAVAWWMAAVTDIAPLAQKWKDYPLMQNLLLAIYDYMDFKAKEKTKELNEFV